MNRPTFGLLMCAIVAVGVVTVSGQAPEKPSQGFLSALKVGQSVTMKEVAGRFTISFDDAVQDLSYKIVKIGPDFVTIEDLGGLTETTIPVYSIKSSVRFKVPK